MDDKAKLKRALAALDELLIITEGYRYHWDEADRQACWRISNEAFLLRIEDGPSNPLDGTRLWD